MLLELVKEKGFKGLLKYIILQEAQVPMVLNIRDIQAQLGWDRHREDVFQGKRCQREWEIKEKTCSHCHSNFYCLRCHEGDNLDREAHPLNFRNNHGIEAKANKENCITCHREYAFCNECHAIEMVMPKNHSYAGWSNTTDGGLHAKSAQSDFDYCQSCHSDLNGDVVCMTCHGI